MSSPFPSFPVSKIAIPSSPLINSAYTFVKENTSEPTLNHCIRSIAFGLILMKKFPPLASNSNLDTETIVLSALLHDMGWATTKSLISKDKRFEVDGAFIARDFVNKETGSSQEHGHWDKHRIQLVWDTIALHATPSIAMWKEPEVMATHLGILGDFLGVNIHVPLQMPEPLITIDEYQEVVKALPRLGFKEHVRDLMCGFCRDKPDTTMDNFVSEYGRLYGTDGKGGGREEFIKLSEEKNFVKMLEGSLDFLTQYE